MVNSSEARRKLSMMVTKGITDPLPVEVAIDHWNEAGLWQGQDEQQQRWKVLTGGVHESGNGE